MADILGSVFIDNTGYNTATDLKIDASADTTDHEMLLQGGTDFSSLSGLAVPGLYFL